jgi:hypothetical protein
MYIDMKVTLFKGSKTRMEHDPVSTPPKWRQPETTPQSRFDNNCLAGMPVAPVSTPFLPVITSHG